MKKLMSIALLSIVTSLPAYAADFSYSGAVKLIRTHEVRYGENVSWITLENFTNAGTCVTRSNGNVLVRIKNDEAGKRFFSTALSAKMAGKSITVYLDDTQKDSSNACFLQYMDV